MPSCWASNPSASSWNSGVDETLHPEIVRVSGSPPDAPPAPPEQPARTSAAPAAAAPAMIERFIAWPFVLWVWGKGSDVVCGWEELGRIDVGDAAVRPAEAPGSAGRRIRARRRVGPGGRAEEDGRDDPCAARGTGEPRHEGRSREGRRVARGADPRVVGARERHDAARERRRGGPARADGVRGARERPPADAQDAVVAGRGGPLAQAREAHLP